MLEFMWMTCWDERDKVDPSEFESAAHAEAAADWEGEDGVFAQTLVELRWLDKLPDGHTLRVHDFWEHCANYVRQRMHERRKSGKEVCETFKNFQKLRKNAPLNPDPRPQTQDPRPKTGEDSDSDPKKDSMSTRQTEIDPPAQKVIDDWNEMAKTCDLPQPRGVPRKGSTRAKALAARVKEPAWMADYPGALAKIPKSEFLTGKTTSNGTWRANLDWFLRPDTVVTILEGKYDGVAAVNGPKPPGERPLRYDPITRLPIKPGELEYFLLPSDATPEQVEEVRCRGAEWEMEHWPEDHWSEDHKKGQ